MGSQGGDENQDTVFGRDAHRRRKPSPLIGPKVTNEMVGTGRTLLILAAIGVLCTLATGVFKVQLIESLDARHYGIPLDWRVESDWCGCTQFSWGNFAFDAFFYLITGYGIVLAYRLAMSSGRRAS